MNKKLRKQNVQKARFLLNLPALAIGLSLSSHAATYNVNPGNYHTELAKVNNGDTVILADGIYVLNDTDISNLTRRSGVQYSGNKYQTIFRSNSSSLKQVTFNGKQNITLRGIHWDGIALYIRDCSNHLIDWSQFTNSKPENNIVDLFHGYLGSNGVIQWSNGRQNYNTFKMKGFKYNAHPSCLVRKNDVRGKLRGAYDVSNANSLTMEDNYGERASGGSTAPSDEDHATYHHDIKGLVHCRNTMRGWSDSSSGGGLKIKNVEDVEVYDNTYFTSGILGRVETSNGQEEFKNVWIRNNTLNDGDLNIWTPFFNPTQVRISNNQVKNGNITAQRDITSSFNSNLGYTWSNGSPVGGGVFSNSAKSFHLAPVIAQSGNTTL